MKKEEKAVETKTKDTAKTAAKTTAKDTKNNTKQEKQKKVIKVPFILFLLFLVLLFGAVYMGVVKYQEYVTAKVQQEQKEQEIASRVAKIEAVLQWQQEVANKIKDGKESKAMISQITSSAIIKKLLAEKLIGDDLAKIDQNNIVVGNEVIQIPDYELSKEGIPIKVSVGRKAVGDYPKIMLEDIGIFTQNGELISTVSANGKSSFDPFKYKGQRLIYADDEKDGDISKNVKVSYDVPKDKWTPGNTYTITYSVTNSRGKQDVKVLKVKVIDLLPQKDQVQQGTEQTQEQPQQQSSGIIIH